MFKPGKGAHLVLNEGVLNFIHEALADIEQVYTDVLHDAKPSKVLSLLLLKEDGTSKLEWQKAKDGYGTKVYATRPYKNGELRVTVVLMTSRSTGAEELKLDIREWYEAD